MAKRISLGKVDVEFRAVKEKVEVRLIATFTIEDLMAFLDDLRYQAEEVVSRMRLLDKDS
jgi:hypothetical protein